MSSFIEALREVVLGASLADLNAAREIIDEAIEAAEAKAIDDVRAEIQRLAASVGRSVEEILSMSNAGKRRKNDAPLVVKFRNTVNPDETWSGRGKRPRWLRKALANGAELSDFAAGETEAA